MIQRQPFRIVERYILASPIAAGGMATVYFGRPLNLRRVVAIKQLQPHFAHVEAFVSMFLDEVRLLSRIRHKNVVSPIDHLHANGEFFIVMEYVDGESLSRLVNETKGPLGARLASKIMSDVLAGLDAAHEALDPSGRALHIVHRDVSPHNIMVGTDGDARILDFGIAKAAWRAEVTEHGQVKGKPGYMAPEQLALQNVDRRTDVYGAGICLWELLTGKRLFAGQPLQSAPSLARTEIVAPGALVPGLPPALDAVVLRALCPEPKDRFAGAREMADALIDAVPPARGAEIGQWIAKLCAKELERRGNLIAELEEMAASELTRQWSTGPSAPAARPVEHSPALPPDRVATGDHATPPTEQAAAQTLDISPRGRNTISRKQLLAGAMIALAGVALGVWYTTLTRGGAGQSANIQAPLAVTIDDPDGPPPRVPQRSDTAALARDEAKAVALNQEKKTNPPVAAEPVLPPRVTTLPEPWRRQGAGVSPNAHRREASVPAELLSSQHAGAPGSAATTAPGPDAATRAEIPIEYDPLHDPRRR